jgi:hypothetical protein
VTAPALSSPPLRLRLAHSLRELYVYSWTGTDADVAEVVRALKGASRLESLRLFPPGDSGTGALTATEISKLLVDNSTLTRLTFGGNESKSETSPLSALVDAVRSNPHSALTDLDVSRCVANDTGAVALVSLIELPRIRTLKLTPRNAQAAVRNAIRDGARGSGSVLTSVRFEWCVQFLVRRCRSGRPRCV